MARNKNESTSQDSKEQTIVMNGHCQIHHKDLEDINIALCSVNRYLSEVLSEIHAMNNLLGFLKNGIEKSASSESKMFDIMLQKIIDAEKEKYYDD